MKTHEKLLIAQSLLPVLADFLEDQPFNQRFKMKANLVINQIRSLDKMFLEGAEVKEFEQQIDIQRWFRQQVEEAFTTHNE